MSSIVTGIRSEPRLSTSTPDESGMTDSCHLPIKEIMSEMDIGRGKERFSDDSIQTSGKEDSDNDSHSDSCSSLSSASILDLFAAEFSEVPQDYPVEDCHAADMQELMFTDTMVATAQSLLEGYRLLDEINLFASHVPSIVMTSLGEELKRRNPCIGLSYENPLDGTRRHIRENGSNEKPLEESKLVKKSVSSNLSFLRESFTRCSSTTDSLRTSNFSNEKPLEGTTLVQRRRSSNQSAMRKSFISQSSERDSLCGDMSYVEKVFGRSGISELSELPSPSRQKLPLSNGGLQSIPSQGTSRTGSFTRRLSSQKGGKVFFDDSLASLPSNETSRGSRSIRSERNSFLIRRMIKKKSVKAFHDTKASTEVTKYTITDAHEEERGRFATTLDKKLSRIDSSDYDSHEEGVLFAMSEHSRDISEYSATLRGKTLGSVEKFRSREEKQVEQLYGAIGAPGNCSRLCRSDESAFRNKAEDQMTAIIDNEATGELIEGESITPHHLALRALGIGVKNTSLVTHYKDPFPCDGSSQDEKSGPEAARPLTTVEVIERASITHHRLARRALGIGVMNTSVTCYKDPFPCHGSSRDEKSGPDEVRPLTKQRPQLKKALSYKSPLKTSSLKAASDSVDLIRNPMQIASEPDNRHPEMQIGRLKKALSSRSLTNTSSSTSAPSANDRSLILHRMRMNNGVSYRSLASTSLSSSSSTGKHSKRKESKLDDKRLEMQKSRLKSLKIKSEPTGINSNTMESHPPTPVLLPLVSAHQSALLFVDISGFTKLSIVLSPEALSKSINSYFELILNQVTAHGGDILKFAGDAVFVEWRASSRCEHYNQPVVHRSPMTLSECVKAAALCASDIVANGSDFTVMDIKHTRGSLCTHVSTLNVHCGLGVGELVGIHVGNDDFRREYLFLGDPIAQISQADLAASLGEVAASPQFLVTLRKTCTFGSEITTAASGTPIVIARRSQKFFKPTSPKTLSKPGEVKTKAASNFSHDLEEWNLELIKEYHKLLSLYVHQVMVRDRVDLHVVQSKATPQERFQANAELRSVYVMFINPLLSVRVTGIEEADKLLYKVLNNVINLATRELERFRGHLRQFIVDDKGLVLIATFGLRGSTFPNMVAERALPATIVLHNALQNELGIQNRIGATIGEVYCGVVGGTRRHEYAVLGPSVNLAARLMCLPQNPGILVDDAVRLVADRSFGFNALSPVAAKGYTDLVPIFEPLSPLERSWGRVQPNFCGRKSELKAIIEMTKEMALGSCHSKMAFVSAESGMGKSALAVHTIECVRKFLGGTERRVLVTKHVSNESDILLPFGVVRSILVDVLSFYCEDEDSSIEENSSCEWDGSSSGTTSEEGLSQFAEKLESICNELNAPPAFHQLVRNHLLGVEGDEESREPLIITDLADNLNSLIKCMVDVLKLCTIDADVVIVALDDVHYMDEVSWKVIQELFHAASNIVFICMARPLSKYNLAIPSAFWEQLNQQYSDEGRFIHIKLDRLNKADIKLMIAKTLGLQVKDVTEVLLHNVLMTSGGNPHFANEILDMMKTRRVESGTQESDSVDTVFASVEELILSRLDAFSPSVRHILNVATVLGSSFELVEVVAILRRMVSPAAQTAIEVDKVRADLDFLVSEGVLRLLYDGYNMIGNDGTEGMQESMLDVPTDDFWAVQDSMYNFSHDMWRSAILKLMLDSRQRDIHRIIGLTLENHIGFASSDYLSRMKLFGHWKACGESTKAAALALSIGKSFENLGLHEQSVKLYNDSLAIWRGTCEDDGIGGFTDELIASLTNIDLEMVINLFEALGKDLISTNRKKDSEEAFLAAKQLQARLLERPTLLERIRDNGPSASTTCIGLP